MGTGRKITWGKQAQAQAQAQACLPHGQTRPSQQVALLKMGEKEVLPFADSGARSEPRTLRSLTDP